MSSIAGGIHQFFMRCTGDSMRHMILINPFDGDETNDAQLAHRRLLFVALQIEFMTQ